MRSRNTHATYRKFEQMYNPWVLPGALALPSEVNHGAASESAAD